VDFGKGTRYVGESLLLYIEEIAFSLKMCKRGLSAPVILSTIPEIIILQACGWNRPPPRINVNLTGCLLQFGMAVLSPRRFPLICSLLYGCSA
jgi:hypothetical protein